MKRRNWEHIICSFLVLKVHASMQQNWKYQGPEPYNSLLLKLGSFLVDLVLCRIKY